MAYGLTMGTERATALQTAIQDELTKRGYSQDADPVMAEYITIMIINNKTSAQIATELEDLIGSDFDRSFVDWLFAEVAKGAPESEVPAPAVPAVTPTPAAAAAVPPPRESPPHLQDGPSRRPPHGPRAGPLYQQALAQALPSTSPGQKRTASARSPSPSGHPHKIRRTDLPTGPRAMQGGPSGRSLLERMSSPRGGGHDNRFKHDEVQARIDNITGAGNAEMAMMMGPGFPMPGMPGMDMTAMANMQNPMLLQEMMMNQMALMSQMAGAMGILNPAAMGMNGPQFPMQPGMGGDMGMMNGMNGGPGMDGRGRGRGRGGMRGGRGRGGHAPSSSNGHSVENAGSGPGAPPLPASTPVVAPQPTTPGPAPQISPSASQGRTGLAPPERPQSPTLCKFGLKCTNAVCRYSHPSPVATPESGVVLSNDPCENGKNCKDKDCIKAHVSPAVLKATGEQLNPKAPVFTPTVHASSPTPQTQTPCRFGAACTRPGCSFLHPARQNAQPCRWGSGCTKATCPYQHPEGRVLPSSFHRGLAPTGGLVNVPTPETGSMGAAASHNRSVTFNKSALNGTSAAALEQKVKELEEKKLEAQAAVAKAQAAVAAKKEDSKPVEIAAA